MALFSLSRSLPYSSRFIHFCSIVYTANKINGMKYTNNAMYSAVAVRSDYIVCFRFHFDLLVFGLAGHLFGITGHVSLMDLEQLCLKPRFTYIYGESPRINRRPKKNAHNGKCAKIVYAVTMAKILSREKMRFAHKRCRCGK